MRTRPGNAQVKAGRLAKANQVADVARDVLDLADEADDVGVPAESVGVRPPDSDERRGRRRAEPRGRVGAGARAGGHDVVVPLAAPVRVTITLTSPGATTTPVADIG